MILTGPLGRTALVLSRVIVLSSINKVSLVSFCCCSNTGSMRGWKNILEMIELFGVNKVILV